MLLMILPNSKCGMHRFPMTLVQASFLTDHRLKVHRYTAVFNVTLTQRHILPIQYPLCSNISSAVERAHELSGKSPI